MTNAGDNPPNAILAPLSGRCLSVGSAHDANQIVLWDCELNQWLNEEWDFNNTSGAIASLDTDSSLTGLCLTPEPPPPPNFKIGT